ncbi:MAG: GntR family transcriptional regulator [Phycisphaerae bacterium]
MKTSDYQQPVSKHFRIEEEIRRNILTGKWSGGDVIPSAKELSNKHGTSPLTARKAVETLVSKGVLVAKQGLGTFVSQRPTLQSVGVVLGVGSEPNSQGVLGQGRYLQLIENGCNRWSERHLLKCQTYLYHSDKESMAPNSSLWRDVCEDRLDGLILVGHPSEKLAVELIRRRIPVVAIAQTSTAVPYVVKADYRNMMDQAVELTVSTGRKGLGLIGGVTVNGPDRNEFTKEAFILACVEKCLSIRREWIKVTDAPITQEEGHRLTMELLDGSDRPEGLIVSDDVLAVGVCKALTERGIKVPETMTIITHSNAGSAPINFAVSLTRMEFNPSAMVEQAANMLTNMIRGEPPTECVLLCKPTLIRGVSC